MRVTQNGTNEYKTLTTPLQKWFANTGFRDLNDQQAIELLLSLTMPSQSANKTAKKCVSRFQNLYKFVEASNGQLQKVGVPDKTILSIRLIQEIPLHVLKQKVLEQPMYQSSREFYDYLKSSMQELDKEVFKVVYLDESNHISGIVDLFIGTRNQVPISARDIIESALNHGADALILVHNHTSGNPEPSKTDTIFTRDIILISILLQINILDHIIIGMNAYFSFADAGLLQKYKDSFLNMKIKGILGASSLYQPYIETIEALL
ncbi:MAG: hypothetical protein A2Z29_10235 [Chloroflexi bacterium RBG_16_56_11]|nr:MAG: hypothetical protein A2Z29_10235 [Chloroflexi bacterium RBG_16_56_11]